MDFARNTQTDVLVIGAGAAGMMAAGRAARTGARVLLLEKTGQCGKKILVSGKTRCNLTNTAGLAQFISMYGPNGRFLHGAFSRFFRDELLSLFTSCGVATKVERGGRIFPVSDDARDVVTAMRSYMTQGGVRIIFNSAVSAIIPEGPGGFTVRNGSGDYHARCVVVAAGGASWPATGSTGDGYKMANALGHSLSPLLPALVPLVVKETQLAKSMQGVSLRNIRACAFQCDASAADETLIPSYDSGRGAKKSSRPPVLESRFGEMLFTHFGLGGPVILLMSLTVVRALAKGPVSILIDLKPALSRDQLHRRLLADLDRFGKRKIASILKEYLPAKMIEPLLALAGIDAHTPAHQIGAGGREKIIALFKALRFNISGSLPLSKAIVTAGGVSLKEVAPRTMASRIHPGLFFCGEVLDLDADTGGYNLQAAFSTGYVAGESAAQYARRRP
jgi:predicted flavoprotein YhiN